MKILVIGEINPDLIFHGFHAFPELGKEVLFDDTHLTLGSASLICAVGLARLGNRLTFFGMVGEDPWGDFCLERMTQEGIDASRVIRSSEVKTGITVSLTGPSDRALVTHLGAIEALTEAHVPEDVFDGQAHLHMATYFMQKGLRPGVRSLMKKAKAKGLTTSLDPGYDPSERWEKDLIETLKYVDVFLPNEVELEGIAGSKGLEEGLRRLDNGHTLVVAKLGRNGCAALVDGRLVQAPAFAVEPVDTTGAGDSFNAGFLHAWLRKEPIEEAMRLGAACGALSTRALGGTTAQPSLDEALEFMRSRSGEPGNES